MQELKELPERVEALESQILQLRTEMKDGFSAIRADLRAEVHGVEAGLRTELHEVRDTLRTELHEVRDELRDEMRELREDIRIGVEESQNLTRGLHAEAMRAIASVDASLRREVVSRLDQILERQRPGDSPSA